jgi:exodeoxyribonuclease VII large subunit
VRAAPTRGLDEAAAGMAVAADRLRRRAPQLVVSELRHVDALANRLSLLDPTNLLRRGWSITRTPSGEVVRSVDQIATGDTIVSRFPDGEITSTVTSPPNREDPPR